MSAFEGVGFINLPHWQGELQKLLIQSGHKGLLSLPVLADETFDVPWKALEGDEFFSCVHTGIVFEDNIDRKKLPRVVITSNAELALNRLKKGLYSQTFFNAAAGGVFPAFKMAAAGCLGKIKKIMVQNDSVASFVLSRIEGDCKTLEEAVYEAQWQGIASENPNKSLHGFVARERLSLQIAELFGVFVEPSKINTVGISTLEKTDVEIAKELACSIRLIAIASFENGVVKAVAEPCVIPSSYVLAQARAGCEVMYASTFNGESHIYCAPVSSHETVLRGILCDLMCREKPFEGLEFYNKEAEPFDDCFYVRLDITDITSTLSAVINVFAQAGIEIYKLFQPVLSYKGLLAGMSQAVVIITEKTNRRAVCAAVETIKASIKLASVCSFYRFIKRE